MSQFFSSFILGIISLSGFFILSVILTLGVKSILQFLKPKRLQLPVQEKPKRKYKKRKPQPKPIRSVEINPDEVDRIYVRKIS